MKFDNEFDIVRSLVFSGNLGRFFSGQFEVKIETTERYYKFENREGIPYKIQVINDNILIDSSGYLNRTSIDKTNSFVMIADNTQAKKNYMEFYNELVADANISYIYNYEVS